MQDGRLQAGDQLLSVDGKSLIGISQERAAEYMMETGPVVTLQVARQGAIYHGLATILSQPSPQVNRGESVKGGVTSVTWVLHHSRLFGGGDSMSESRARGQGERRGPVGAQEDRGTGVTPAVAG